MCERIRHGLIAALVVGALAVIPVGMAACGQEERLTGVLRSPPLDSSGVALPAVTDAGSRARMSFVADRGSLLLVYFGYTSCPDVCPTTFADLRMAIGDLPEGDRDRIEVAMVTVDPQRDTEAKMTDYLGFFFENWRAYRTTDSKALAKAEKALAASHRVGRKDRDGTYEVSHTATLSAVNRKGEVLVEWPFGSSAEDISADLRLLLEENRGR
ncbi:MAG: SCO family protein [Solirubrobacterales bacterium]